MIVIHAGLRKAGSSTIQAFMAANDAALRELGVDYPGVGRGGRTGHVNLVHNIKSSSKFSEERGGIAQLIEHRRAHPTPALVVSSEMFEGMDASQVARTRDLLTPLGEEFRIVFILRDLVDLMPSSYAQKIKYGFNSYNFDRFYKERMQERRVDLAETLQIWTDAFGTEQVVTRVLDRALLRNGDLIDDFLAVIGLDPDAAAVHALTRPPNQNLAPGWRVLEAVRALSIGRHGLPDDHPIFGHLVGRKAKTAPLKVAEILGKAAQAVGERRGWNAERGNYMTREQAKECLTLYRTSLKRIKQHTRIDLPAPRTLAERGFVPRDRTPSVRQIAPAELRSFYDEVAETCDGTMAALQAQATEQKNGAKAAPMAHPGTTTSPAQRS